MQRIFWRHAQAGWAAQDLARTLTDTGLAQAQAAAQWLKMQGIDYPVYSSEALRARQTAECFSPSVRIAAGLNPDGSTAEVDAALAAIADENAVVVGHLPWIGEVVGRYLGTASGYVEAHTAEVFWLERQDGNWILKGRFTP